MVKFVSRFGGESAHLEALHQFFEQLLNVRYQAPSSGYDGGAETENLGFLAWEMFIYTVATFIRAERFDAILPLLAPYYVHSSNRGVGVLRSFDILDPGFHLLDYVRKHRLKIGWTSVSASILRDRATHRHLPFEALIEADTLLWLRTRLDDQANGSVISRGWFPRTLHFCENIETVPLYVRMTRPDFFQKVSGLLGVATVADIKVRLGALPEDAFPTAGNFWGSARAYFSFLRLNT